MITWVEPPTAGRRPTPPRHCRRTVVRPRSRAPVAAWWSATAGCRGVAGGSAGRHRARSRPRPPARRRPPRWHAALEDHRLDTTVALLDVGQQGAPGAAGEVRDERGMPAVQRREDVPEVVPARSPDPAQGCADRARLTEHGQLLVRQLPERPAARALVRRRRPLDGPRRGRRGPSPSRRGRACRATARRSARPRPPVAPRGGRRTGTSRTRAPAPTDPAGSPATGSAAGGVHARTPATRSGRRRRTRDQVQCWAGAGQARRPPPRRRSLRASCRNLRQLGRPNAEVGHPQARCITPARSAPVASPT